MLSAQLRLVPWQHHYELSNTIKILQTQWKRYRNVKRSTVHGYMATITKIIAKLHDNKRQSPIACKRQNCETAKSGRG